MVDTDVLVRVTTTTTYHFGRIEAICGSTVPAHELTAMKLDEALATRSTDVNLEHCLFRVRIGLTNTKIL